MRHKAGKTHEDLKAAGIASRSKMSAIETGKTRVRAADIYAFAALYRLADEQTAQLLVMAESADSAESESLPAVYSDTSAEDDVAYRLKAVPIGPFTEMPPLDLWRLLSCCGARSGSTVCARAREWLAGALEAAGVALGDYDREVIALLADDCATTVQVVAGWIGQLRCSLAYINPDLARMVGACEEVTMGRIDGCGSRKSLTSRPHPSPDVRHETGPEGLDPPPL